MCQHWSQADQVLASSQLCLTLLAPPHTHPQPQIPLNHAALSSENQPGNSVWAEGQWLSWALVTWLAPMDNQGSR